MQVEKNSYSYCSNYTFENIGFVCQVRDNNKRPYLKNNLLVNSSSNIGKNKHDKALVFRNHFEAS